MNFASRGRVPLGIGYQRSGPKKLEWRGYRAEKEVWRYLQPSRYITYWLWFITLFWNSENSSADLYTT